MTKPQPPPILDFSVFYGHDSQAKAQLVQRVRECCLNNGFFQITGHKVSPELQRRTFDCAKRFFDLPLIEKKKIERSKNYPWYPADKQLTLAGPDAFNRGYEAFQSHMSQPGSAPDRKEGLFLGPDLAEDHPYCVQKKLNCGPNRWPQGLDDLEEFKLVSMEYYAALFQLAKDVVAVLALTMDYEETFFDPLTEGAIATLRYLHYPPQPVGDAEAGWGLVPIGTTVVSLCSCKTELAAFRFWMSPPDNGWMCVALSRMETLSNALLTRAISRLNQSPGHTSSIWLMYSRA